MEIIKYKISGATLLQHNVRLANPLDPGPKAMKALTSVRKKTDDIHEQLSDLEYEYGLYFDETVGPFIPGVWMDACLVNGGKLQKNGSKIKRACLVIEDIIKLNYKGPRDIESLKKDYSFRYVNAVTVGQQKIMRTRPLFKDCNCTFSVKYDESLVSPSEITQALELCGSCLGTGDFRPRFGRFTVELVK
jgi:hypothetical protein